MSNPYFVEKEFEGVGRFRYYPSTGELLLYAAGRWVPMSVVNSWIVDVEAEYKRKSPADEMDYPFSAELTCGLCGSDGAAPVEEVKEDVPQVIQLVISYICPECLIMVSDEVADPDYGFAGEGGEDLEPERDDSVDGTQLKSFDDDSVVPGGRMPIVPDDYEGDYPNMWD